MKQDLILLSAKAYDMPIEGTTERRKGISVWYVSGFEQCVNETGKDYGYQPTKESLPLEFMDKIVSAGGCPVKIEADMVMRSTAKGTMLKIHDFVVKGKLELKEGK